MLKPGASVLTSWPVPKHEVPVLGVDADTGAKLFPFDAEKVNGAPDEKPATAFPVPHAIHEAGASIVMMSDAMICTPAGNKRTAHGADPFIHILVLTGIAVPF